MPHDYRRLEDPGEGLRLHLNENTGGCSPRVLEALATVTPEQIAFYPDYSRITAACAAHLSIPEDHLLLTNGLDEGILAAAIGCFRTHRPDERAEAIVVEPAFDMYAACIAAAGGSVVAIQPRPDFSFPLTEVLESIHPRTRLIFLTHPNNPTGQPIPRPALRAIATHAAHATVFVDEAYVDFAEDTFLDEVPSHANVLIGRTFAKAYGLAALRIGAVIGTPDALAPLARVIPPYSLNIYAVAGLQAALGDPGFVQWYRGQVKESRELMYAACERLSLQYWHSAANFVLIRIGDRTPQIVERLAERRVFVRDRSQEPGCAGCIRITTGIVEHTRTCIAALEEALCGEAV